MRFNAPPNWPVPPDWSPGPGQDVNPAWPPAPPGWQFWIPDEWIPAAAMTPPAGTPPHAVPRWLVSIVLVVIVASYGVAVALTKDAWSADGPRSVTTASFAVRPLAGDTAGPDAIARTREVLASRVGRLGGRDVVSAVDGNSLKVTAAGVTEAQLRGIDGTGRFNVRPVIHAMPSRYQGPAASPVPATPSPVPADVGQRIADEKALRQSSQPQIQLLALQFQATRCDQQDVLGGNDDPHLPLVTCSDDHKEVYLLDKSIIGGDQIKDASSGRDQHRGDYVVYVIFKKAAADTWASFTAANIGTRAAFTVDSQVVSAPALLEAIPTGRTQLHGQFTADSAKSFAAVVASGPLPMAVDLQSVATRQVEPAFWSAPRIAVLCGGIMVLFAVIVGLVLLRPTASR